MHCRTDFRRSDLGVFFFLRRQCTDEHSGADVDLLTYNLSVRDESGARQVLRGEVDVMTNLVVDHSGKAVSQLPTDRNGRR